MVRLGNVITVEVSFDIIKRFFRDLKVVTSLGIMVFKHKEKSLHMAPHYYITNSIPLYEICTGSFQV